MGSLCPDNVYCHTGFLLLLLPHEGALIFRNATYIKYAPGNENIYMILV